VVPYGVWQSRPGYILSALFVGELAGLGPGELGGLLAPLRALDPLKDELLLGLLQYVAKGVPAAKGLPEFQAIVAEGIRRVEAAPTPTLSFAIQVQVPQQPVALSTECQAKRPCPRRTPRRATATSACTSCSRSCAAPH
jgi:hypothetical protein